jgi:predicted anti-sigma-YlaC factor YlaD
LKRLFSRRRDAGTPPGDLTCRELVELVSDYLEGALSERDRARFESHIEMCEGCTAYLVQMRMTLRMVGALEPEAVSPEVEQELLAAFRGWKSGGTA